MAILSEETKVASGVREWNSFKLLNDSSVDETASSEVDIRNAGEVTLFVETSAGVSGGVVKLETAITSGGPYFVAGSVTTSAASTGYADTIGGGDAGLPAKYARARIETVISGGTIDAYILVQK